MKINWQRSISFRINSAMLLILVALFTIASMSFWMTGSFNTLSAQVSNQLLPELARSSDLHLAIKNVHRKMDALARVKSNAGNRVIVKELMAELDKISLAIDDIANDQYSQSMSTMTNTLLPIVNAYSLEVTRSFQGQVQLQRKIQVLDEIYLTHIQQPKEDLVGKEQINKLYTLSRSLADLPTTFLFKRSTQKIYKSISMLSDHPGAYEQFFNVISNPEQGIIAILQHRKEISVNLSILNTQTNVIVEQLIAVSLAKVDELESQVKAATIELKGKSTDYSRVLISIVLITTLFTLAVMLYFHQNVSKRLMTIARHLGSKENKQVLEKETLGASEISIIAKSILKYREHNLQQRSKITASMNQLKFIIENSIQAVIIYSDDSIVYCNKYAQKMLDINLEASTNIVSQNLLIAIDDKCYLDRLKVGAYYFRFYATDIEWNSKASTMALLTDITTEVHNEKQLMKNLETVKDESLIDVLTGLYNRRKLELFIEQKTNSEYALIIADIDWFKAFNDHYGHAEGDLCITKVAMALKESLRTDDDIAVRYGGEEFLILLVGSTMEQAERVAERIQSIILKFDIKHEKSKFDQLSLSLGVAHSTEFENGNWQALFEIADKRLYSAKANGRARTVSKGDMKSLST